MLHLVPVCAAVFSLSQRKMKEQEAALSYNVTNVLVRRSNGALGGKKFNSIKRIYIFSYRAFIASLTLPDVLSMNLKHIPFKVCSLSPF